MSSSKSQETGDTIVPSESQAATASSTIAPPPPPPTTTTELPIRSAVPHNPLVDINEDLPPSYETPGQTIESAAFRAEDFAKDGKKHIIVAASGSVATIKLPNLIRDLGNRVPKGTQSDIAVRVILTKSAAKFLSGVSAENPSVDSLRSLPNVEAVYLDEDEWAVPWQRGHPVLHIELRKWADIMVIAPLDANTLAKMTTGIADNLLLSVLRAWDPDGRWNPAGRQFRTKHLIVAPAMNTAMWIHPSTKAHIKTLKEDWAEARISGTTASPSPGFGSHSYKVMPWATVMGPIEAGLACGDFGTGAMLHEYDIAKEVWLLSRKFS